MIHLFEDFIFTLNMYIDKTVPERFKDSLPKCVKCDIHACLNVETGGGY